MTDSSWIRAAERVNSVHPRHDPSSFLARLTHYVFTFHDSTFECLAYAEPRVSLEAGATREVVASALREG